MPFAKEFTYAFLFNLALLIWRLLELYGWPFPLFGDEAQYWTWAQDPAWGYYSKPPVVAWLITATTWMAGDSEFAIRLASPLLHCATAMVIFAIGRQFSVPKLGLWASITYATIPAVTVSSTLISTDPALLFFWAMAFLFFVRAMEKNRSSDWLLSGISAGLGMLSKYSMLFFLFSALLFPKNAKRFGEMYRNRKFWLAVLVALAVYAPNLWWNYDSSWVSYLHTKDNAALEKFGVNAAQFMEFFGAQFVVFGPILFFFLLRHVFRAAQNISFILHPRIALLYSFVQPMLLVMLMLSLFTRAHANWLAPIYIAGTLWVAMYFLQERRLFWLKLSIVLHLLLAVGFYHYDAVAKMAGVELTKKTDPFFRLRGWPELAAQLKNYQQDYPDDAVFADERMVVASLKYYLRDEAHQPATIYKWDNDADIHDHYEMSQNLTELSGKNALILSRRNELEKFTSKFSSLQELGVISIPIHPNQSLEFKVFRGENYQGM